MTERVRIGVMKDPMSWLTHFIGMWISIGAFFVLVSSVTHDPLKLVAMTTYGMMLVFLFFCSSAYHFFDLGERGNRWLRRLDHSAIFLFIAATYVPPLALFLSGNWRIAMLTCVLLCALMGVVMKLFWIDCPNWLSTGLYLALGWIFVIPAHLILPQLTLELAAPLLIGGLAYTIGAFVYLKRRPDPWPSVFGHHEVWHLFVLVGAAAHFAFTYSLIDVPYAPM